MVNALCFCFRENPVGFRVVRFLMFLQQLADPFVAFWANVDKRMEEFVIG